MEINYHMTENKYLESIFKEGLVPQQGIRSNLIGESKKAVFYSQGFEGVIAMFFMMIERFIEYCGSSGDIHIDAYNQFLKMADAKQKQGKEISQTLASAIENEKRIVETVYKVRNASNWQEFLGDGVYLSITNINEEDSNSESTFYNSWTTSIISPENISVVILNNQITGEVLTSKYDIVNCFISKVPLEQMQAILYDTAAKESKREKHLLWQIMSKYYTENRAYYESYFENYDIIEIPISSYLNKKENVNRIV